MTLTLELSAQAQARLEAEAVRRGITLNQLVAQIAEAFPADAGPVEVQQTARRLAFVGAGASDKGTTDRIDDLLSDGFGHD